MDEQEIKDQYRAFYRAAIAKDRSGMEATLDESFHLTHMTGMRQSRRFLQEHVRQRISQAPFRACGSSFSSFPSAPTVTIRRGISFPHSASA